ncbi:MAG: ATP-binding protein [Bacteroidales bacterium]|nr:ATP-binding protein [Bacteroidales bacterium]MDD3860814.1 ATP-binding protein [Bacteroidales bacterium]HOZ30512.1 ATP-binding protein [Bacteroidales bacterium]
MTDKSLKIAIASGKGGTGKTLISTSMFYAIQEKYENSVLLDCDAEEPNSLLFFDASLKESLKVVQKVPVIDTDKCVYCGKCHDYCEYNAIFIIPPSRIIKVIEELCHGCGACSVACEYDAIIEKDTEVGRVNLFVTDNGMNLVEARMKSGVMSPVPVIKAAHKSTSDKDIVIMDSPPGTSCPFIQTVVEADYVILVTEPTPFGLSDLKQSVNTLKTMHKQYGVVINRAGLGDTKVYDYLKSENIELLAEIPFDKEIAILYSTGKIVAAHDDNLKALFMKIFESIYNSYGNSGNQR